MLSKCVRFVACPMGCACAVITVLILHESWLVVLPAYRVRWGLNKWELCKHCLFHLLPPGSRLHTCRRSCSVGVVDVLCGSWPC